MPFCYGPCSLPGRRCPGGYLPCYEDCCKRGESFCNNDKNEQRCQQCDLRKDQCGNFAMPPECDLYCHKILSKPDGSGQVSGAYKTITIALGVVVPVLVLVVLFVYCIKRRQRRNRKSSTASNSMPESDQLSLIESTISGSSREEKGVQIDLTHHMPPTQTPPSSGQIPPPPLTPGQTRIPEAPPQNVQPAEDLQRRGGEGNPGHTRPDEDPHAGHSPRPGDVHPAGGPQTRVHDTEANTPVGGGPPEDARQGSSCRCGHPKVCRDPRLDGICPDRGRRQGRGECPPHQSD